MSNPSTHDHPHSVSNNPSQETPRTQHSPSSQSAERKHVGMILIILITQIISILLFSPIAVVSFASAAPEEFSRHCEVSGVATPQHILPPSFKNLNTTKNMKNISDFFLLGKLKCSELLKRLPSDRISIRKDFFDRYGILLAEFGPISVCPTMSTCWFGMLSCGEMKQQEKFLQEYDQDLRNYRFGKGLEASPTLPYPGMPTFLGWSMKSLNIQYRVVGPEILFPEISYFPEYNAVLCSYTLTIPGSYRIEIIPREFYPGVLFNYTRKQKIEGYHMIGHKRLVLREKVPASVPMKAHFVSCEPRDTDITLPPDLPTPLPFCSKGNHRGRYLKIPSESLKICGVDKFFPLKVNLRDDRSAQTAREMEYIAADHVGHDNQLRKFLIQQYRNQSQPIEQRLHLQELLRHTDQRSSLCPLIVVNERTYVRESLDTFHEIFAPYRCRYQFYSPLRAKSCLKKLHRTTSYAIGDSLTRELDASINLFLNISKLSLLEIKALLSETPQHVASDGEFQRYVNSLFYPLAGYSHIPFKNIKPTIFSTGFSWAHFTDINLTDFRFRIMNSGLVADVRNELLHLKNCIKILETPSYPTTVYSLERIRRRNIVLRDIFVNQLGFEELDQHQLTAGKLDTRDNLHYAGVPRVMSVIISLNLMCKPP